MIKKPNKKEIKQKVFNIIFDNCEDTELMDFINSITFPFTTKYKNYKDREDKEKQTIYDKCKY